MVGKFDELGMGASDIAELGGAELWQVGLGVVSARCRCRQHFSICSIHRRRSARQDPCDQYALER
jgi:hypothetical protein